MTPKFIQFHTLHSYSAALPNRDDSDAAKRLEFGDATRTRISSQCLKRHWSTTDDRFSLLNIPGAEDSVRSRNIIGNLVMAPSREIPDINQEVLAQVEEAFNIGIYGPSGTTENKRQSLLLGVPETRYLQEMAREICQTNPQDAQSAKEASQALFAPRGSHGPNFRAFRDTARLPSGLRGAMFGRTVTSDVPANIEGAIHVAHAFTIHAQEIESDYFSVVDELKTDDQGAAYLGDTELVAGIFYGYVVVNLPLLVSNLEACAPQDWLQADRSLAAQMCHNLVRVIAQVTPAPSSGPRPPTAGPASSWPSPGRTNPTASPTPSASPSRPGWSRASRPSPGRCRPRTRTTAPRGPAGSCP